MKEITILKDVDLITFKKVDSNNKIYLPKEVTDKFGMDFKIIIYKDKIELIPNKNV